MGGDSKGVPSCLSKPAVFRRGFLRYAQSALWPPSLRCLQPELLSLEEGLLEVGCIWEAYSDALLEKELQEEISICFMAMLDKWTALILLSLALERED